MKTVLYSSSSTHVAEAGLFLAPQVSPRPTQHNIVQPHVQRSFVPQGSCYILPTSTLVPRPRSLASATLPPTRLTSQKAASFSPSAVPPPCSRMISPSVEDLACTAPMHLCTSSRLLSPHGGRRKPIDLLAMQLVVKEMVVVGHTVKPRRLIAAHVPL